jgi:hypothetical protein
MAWTRANGWVRSPFSLRTPLINLTQRRIRASELEPGRTSAAPTSSMLSIEGIQAFDGGRHIEFKGQVNIALRAIHSTYLLIIGVRGSAGQSQQLGLVGTWPSPGSRTVRRSLKLGAHQVPPRGAPTLQGNNPGKQRRSPPALIAHPCWFDKVYSEPGNPSVRALTRRMNLL